MSVDLTPRPAPGDPTPALPGAFYTDPEVYAAEMPPFRLSSTRVSSETVTQRSMKHIAGLPF